MTPNQHQNIKLLKPTTDTLSPIWTKASFTLFFYWILAEDYFLLNVKIAKNYDKVKNIILFKQ